MITIQTNEINKYDCKQKIKKNIFLTLEVEKDVKQTEMTTFYNITFSFLWYWTNFLKHELSSLLPFISFKHK